MVVIASVVSCEQPNDVLHDPPPFAPQDTEWGFRLTASDELDVVRGFTTDGRVVYRTRGLVPFGADYIVASIDTAGGVAREEAAVYRQTLRENPGTIAFGAGRRVLATWNSPVKGIHGCPNGGGVFPPDAGPVVFVTLFDLGERDGRAVPNLPALPVPVDAVRGAGSAYQHVRITPALREISQKGTNPFGPALLPDGSVVFSDGERVYRGTPGDPVPPTQLGGGAFPAVSADGTLLAYARPTGLTSVTTFYSVPLGLGSCTQEHEEIFAGGWETVLRELATGAETVIGSGMEPVFDPLAPRVLVRDGERLTWLAYDGSDLGMLGAPLGSYAPAVSPDGAVAAYSHPARGTAADAFIRTIVR